MPTLLLHGKNTNPQHQFLTPNTQQPNVISTLAFAHAVGVTIVAAGKQNPAWRRILVHINKDIRWKKGEHEGI